MTIRVGDRVRFRNSTLHSHWGEGIVRYADGNFVSWLTDNGRGDRSPTSRGVPCAHASEMIVISRATSPLTRGPGDPPMRRYGPYKPIPKALP